MMVDISLVWISQSWKVLDAPGFAGYEKSGDRTRDGPRLHGRTAPKSAKTQCPRGMPRPYGPRGRWLNMTTNYYYYYYDKHPWRCVQGSYISWEGQG